MLIGIASLGLFVAVWNLFPMETSPGFEGDDLYLFDYEATVEWQLNRYRADGFTQSRLSDIVFARAVRATNFDCVAEDSPHHQILEHRHGYQGVTIRTDCEPLDFSAVSADNIHPKLFVQPYIDKKAYVGVVPGFHPSGDRAVMLRVMWGEYVLVNYDTLVHLDLLASEAK